MSIHAGLNVVTLVMCIITLIVATAALMPQIKQGMALIRDGLLWASLISVVLFIGLVGWSRLWQSVLEPRPTVSPAATASPAPVVTLPAPKVRNQDTGQPPKNKSSAASTSKKMSIAVRSKPASLYGGP